MKLLHPFMPFITEEIWSAIYAGTDSIMLSQFPEVDKDTVFADDKEKMDILMDVIRAIRNIRSEMDTPPSASIEVICQTEDLDKKMLMEGSAHYIKHLTRASRLDTGGVGEKPANAASSIVGNIEIFVPLKGLINPEEESTRLEKEMGKVLKEISYLDKKLSNKDFLERAPKEVVTKEKERFDELLQKKVKIEHAVERLKSLK